MIFFKYSQPSSQLSFYKNTAVRALSAVILVALIMGSLWSPCPGFEIFLTVIAGGIFWEWLSVTKKPSLGIILGLTALQCASFFCSRLLSIAIITIGFIAYLFYGFQKQSSVAWIVYGAILYTFVSLDLLHIFFGTHGAIGVFYLFCVIWLTDSGAFFFGHFLGKRKMAPRISPGKTWAGFWGGTFLAVFTVFTYRFVQYSFHSEGSLYDVAALTLFTFIISVSAHFGDLIESWAKRKLGIKDMGHFIPGHGGFSDRFDSLLFVNYVVVVFGNAWLFLSFYMR